MPRLLVAIALTVLTLLAAADRSAAQGPIAHQPTLAPSALALHEYIYQQFPRELDAVNDDIALAEHNVAFLAARVNSYRPFRSFGVYSPAYGADQLAQLELHAAVQQLECRRRQKDDLWRGRQAIVAAWMAAHASSQR
jgi:hypothetical protein